MENAINSDNRGTVLVVDDAGIMRATCRRALERAGYEVMEAESGEQAMELLDHRSFDVAVLDIRMPGISGVDLLKQIRYKWPTTEVVMMTAYADAEVAEESLNLGAAALLIKPFQHIKILVETVDKSLARTRLQKGRIMEDGPVFEEILRRGGLLDDRQLQEARVVADAQGISMRQALLSMNALTGDDINWAVANYLDFPYIRVSRNMIDPELVREFPADLAHRYTCVPLFRNGNDIHLVTANPFNKNAVSAIAEALKLNPILSMGYEPELKQLIDRIYEPVSQMDFSELINAIQQGKAENSEVLVPALFKLGRLEKVSDFIIRGDPTDGYEFHLSGRIRPLSEK